MKLKPKHRAALEAACNALVPSLTRPDDPDGYWARTAGDLNVADQVVDLVGRLDAGAQTDLRRLLGLLASPLLGLTWGGPLKPITALSAAQQEQLFQQWSMSPMGPIRKGFVSLKKLTTFFYYGSAGPEGTNPNWTAMGYPGPMPQPPATLRPIEPLSVTEDVVLMCGTVVVGSGAGGSVVAGELAEAGEDVIVVEKGPYVAEDGFTQREVEMMDRLYEAHAALTSTDGGIGILAGSCLGGGTTVNWAGAFRTPDYILADWAKRHDAPHFTGRTFRESLDAVAAASCVNTDASFHNPQNQALWDGCKALGYHVAPIPRNTKGCTEAEAAYYGYGGLGDVTGTKMGTLKTYLPKAYAAGARLMPGTEVERILTQGGEAMGVEATHRDAAGNRHKVTIWARRVVVAAGALHTPALLQRSGLRHAHLGRHLYLHPTVAVAARYPAPMNGWWGNMMSAVSNEFANLDAGYGVKIETPPIHAGLFGLALPWTGGAAHKQLMLMAAHAGTFIILTRDRHGGRVKTNSAGRPRIEYTLHPYDRAHMWRGIEGAAEIHVAAGAETLYFPHHTLPVHDAAAGPEALAALLNTLPDWGWKPNQFPLFSAHQMGTCRTGGTAARHPLTPEGAFRGVKNLYVADASAFPEASGVNPMLTIMALAHYTAQALKAERVTGDGHLAVPPNLTPSDSQTNDPP